ncbi:hypothetical protein SUGI_0596720 [Cryptomeria japonica]|uniref:uncharacterized protein LOC131044226 isoform X1 n=2 Tax=Cryptomeria japonica TaxID=3369 RepID=UPI002414B23F|nr:uncharacterized protein LOC131044226 isoform X1 [Cryptomeria japonica]GLJ30167.1 hypothetical protein SUGI_0596720 [Cryptomeria japonica]
MKLKELEGYLGSLQQFSNPKVDLEQYPTGPHIASRMLYMAENTFGDIMDKVVVDLGCGCGTLGLAAMLMGAEHVIGVDMDSDALEIASSNAIDLETEMDFMKCDVGKLSWTGSMVDTVIMNPPFGTRKKGADLEFLSTALKVSAGAVYSLHKTTTREHVQRSAIQNLNAKTAEVLCQLRFDLPVLYKFHKKREVDIMVDLWRFTPN